MATVAHRATDRGASGEGRRLSESGRDRGAATGHMERRPPAKPANEDGVTTGSDAIKPTPTISPNRTPKTRKWNPSGLPFGDDGHGTTLEEGEDKRAIYLQAAVVVDEAFLLELIHKFAYPGACGTNHLR
jgi:hypothetical protein